MLGGKTPVLPPAKLQEVGYKLALYPVMLLSSAVSAMQNTLAALRPESNLPQPPAISFTDLQSVVGFPDYWSKETKYQAKEKCCSSSGLCITSRLAGYLNLVFAETAFSVEQPMAERRKGARSSR